MSGTRHLHLDIASGHFYQLTHCLREEENKLLQAKTEVDKQAAELKQQMEALAEERQKMMPAGTANNDVLDLSVGGVPFSVKRATLTQVEGSLLAAMFSGHWDDSLDHDSQGRIFLDFDPHCFQQILTFLRSRLYDMARGHHTSQPAVEHGKEHAYESLVDYLGLHDALGPCLTAPDTYNSDNLKFSFVSSDVVVHSWRVNGWWTQFAVPSCSNTALMVGDAMLPGQTYYMKVLCHEGLIFAGIAKNASLAVTTSAPNNTAFGWSRKYQSSPRNLSWSAGSSTEIGFPSSSHKHMLLQADLASGYLACIDMEGWEENGDSGLWGRKMPVPVPAETQQSFSFQLIARHGEGHPGRSHVKLMPVTLADIQLFSKCRFEVF